MRVLVTGGTGVVGTAAVQALLEHGHTVRLLSRHADDDARQWPHRVEAFAGDVGDAASILGSGDACDAVLHLAAIVAEHPPDALFQRVNVDGTRHVLAEAERARVARLVFISSLGADRGDSAYHRSKREGERLARSFSGNWSIVRPGNVYGHGDEQVSLMLEMMRSLPAVPIVGDRSTCFQPIWADDVGEALARAVERTDLGERILEIAGDEQISMHDLADHFARITRRDPLRIPVAGTIAELALRAAEKLGIDLPVDSGQLTMLYEGNVIAEPSRNALRSVFGIAPTSLDVGLGRLADSLPEMLPEEGVGGMTRKRFWADIAGCGRSAEDLFDDFRRRFSELTPWHVTVGSEPGTSLEPRAGESLTLGLPLRGHVQVRVEEVTPRSMTFVTLVGHPLAGAVRFLCEPWGELVRFEIQVYDRAANVGDWLALNPIGARLQGLTWRRSVRRVVAESGGAAIDGVQHESARLDDDEAARVNDWLEDLIMARRREANESREAAVPRIVHREAAGKRGATDRTASGARDRSPDARPDAP